MGEAQGVLAARLTSRSRLASLRCRTHWRSRNVIDPVCIDQWIAGVCDQHEVRQDLRNCAAPSNKKHTWRVMSNEQVGSKVPRQRVLIQRNENTPCALSPEEDDRIMRAARQVGRITDTDEIDGVHPRRIVLLDGIA